ncbi:MAG: VOC family protein [Alphaproteobacteria bacterium]|nr:VOC family protein [Alphaproteobacteria bacterium]
MIEPKSILHFTIGVTDLDRATDFYQDVVGCKLLRQNRRHTMSFMEAGGDYFVLTATGLHTPPNGPKGTQFHHAFVVDADAYDDAVAHLKAHGIELLWPQAKAAGPDTQHNTFPGRHVYFHDPDGNGLEITDCAGLGD